MKEVVIVLKPDGGVELEGVGFQGAECVAALQELEALLSQEDRQTMKKPEYFARTPTEVRQH